MVDARLTEIDDPIDRIRDREVGDRTAILIGLYDAFEVLRQRVASADEHDAVAWVAVAALLEDGGNYLTDLSVALLERHRDAYRAALAQSGGH